MAKTRGTSKRRLNEVDQFYLVNHRNDDPKALAKTLGCTLTVVKKFLAALPPVEVAPVEKKKHVEIGHAVLTIPDAEAADKWNSEFPQSTMEYARKHPDRIHIINP